MTTKELESQLNHTMLDSAHKIGFGYIENDQTKVIILYEKIYTKHRFWTLWFFTYLLRALAWLCSHTKYI